MYKNFFSKPKGPKISGRIHQVEFRTGIHAKVSKPGRGMHYREVPDDDNQSHG